MHMRSLLLSHSLSLYHYRLYAFCRLLFVGLKLFFFFFFFDKESAFKKNYHMWEKDEEEASVSINSSHQFFFFLFLSKPRRANTILRSFKPIFYAFYTFLFFIFSTKRHLTQYQLCFRKYRFFETLSLSFPFFSLFRPMFLFLFFPPSGDKKDTIFQPRSTTLLALPGSLLPRI